MKKINVGIIGMGFIGNSHIEAVRRIAFTEIMAVSDVNYELAERKAVEFNIPKCYKTVGELLSDPEITVIHNCTPNNLHAEINEMIIKSGKHLLSEKPLARTSSESQMLVDLLKSYPDTIAGVNFNYRMYPLVQEIKQKIQNNEIGTPRLVHGQYLQDWLLYDTDYNWRIEPEHSGPSRCIADIGSHWMDTVQTIIGSKITEVCADLVTVLPFRMKPIGQVGTFSKNPNGGYEKRAVTTEDYGAILFKMENGVHGEFCVSQVSAGRGNYFNFEVDGSEASVYWNQESGDQMWMGYRDKDNLQIIRNPNNCSAKTNEFTHLAKGHLEGWNDAFKNNIQSFYSFIASGKNLGKDICDFATFEDANYIVKLTEAILKSNQARQWVSL
jgi:predicted dehydrogenase